jgi:type II secretion system protein I
MRPHSIQPPGRLSERGVYAASSPEGFSAPGFSQTLEVSLLRRRLRRVPGFTLLEVSIAMALFFMAVFAILSLVAGTLRNARVLQEPQVDASMLAAELALTNKLAEASDSGDFGDAYPNYSWSRDIQEVGTNGLFEVDWTVHHHTRIGKGGETKMSVLFWRPESQQGRFGPTFR